MDSITFIFKPLPENESLARAVVAAYCARKNPTIDVVNDIKTAVSEAVTNAIVHAYPNGSEDKEVRINAEITGDTLKVGIRDYGVGIPNVIDAMRDFYTSKPSEERSGLGFTIMASFMDSIVVKSSPDEGTEVIMTKLLNGGC